MKKFAILSVSAVLVLQFSASAYAMGKKKPKPAQVSRVHVEVPEGYRGTLELSSPDQNAADQLKNDIRDTSLEVIFKQPVAIQSATLSISGSVTRNLPKDVTRSMGFVTRFKVSTGKSELDGRPQLIVDGSNEDKDCSSLFESKLDGETLNLRYLGQQTLLACKFKDSEFMDPSRVGSRYVQKIGSKLFRNFFGEADDVSMGREFTAQFVRDHGQYLLPSNHPVTQFMQERMERVVRNSDAPNVKPRVFVINADILNAFALPGGDVYVFRGLIDAAKNEAEIMSVLGHEWAHVAARHGTKGMSKQISVLLMSEIAVALLSHDAKHNKSDLVKALDIAAALTVEIGAPLFLLHESREFEKEADLYGSQYALNSGYEPWGLASMFKIFKQLSGNTQSTSLEKILSTHPDHDWRINQGYYLSAFYYPSSPNFIDNTAEYTAIRNQLALEPKLPNAERDILGKAFVDGVNAMTTTQIKNRVLIETKNEDLIKK